MTDMNIETIEGIALGADTTLEALKSEGTVTVIIEKRDGETGPWEGGINGRFMRIPRGKAVEVPVAVARLIQQNNTITLVAKKRVREYASGRGKLIAGA